MKPCHVVPGLAMTEGIGAPKVGYRCLMVTSDPGQASHACRYCGTEYVQRFAVQGVDNL